MLKGFLEAVERFQARGWGFDTDQPDRHLEVEILVGGQRVGTAVADGYRADLEQGGIGGGDHSFVFNFAQPLGPDALDNVTARVAGFGNATLQRWQEVAVEGGEAPQQAQQVSFSGVSQDDTQHPLFILGAARSGTTAITQAMLKATRYRGYYEGHLLDLLAEFYVTLDRFYSIKGDEWSDPHRFTTIKQVPVQFFREGFEGVAIDAMRSVFPDGWWLDKTPTANMIHIAGRLRHIWPQAKFIYLKRRAFENLASRSRALASRTFDVHCREWADAMQAWRQVRSQLAGCALQIDQHYLAGSSDQAAAEIAAFLQLQPDQAQRFRQALSVDRPERTSPNFLQAYDASELGWSADQWKMFDATCGAELDAFGYGRTNSYYASDDPALRVQRL